MQPLLELAEPPHQPGLMKFHDMSCLEMQIPELHGGKVREMCFLQQERMRSRGHDSKQEEDWHGEVRMWQPERAIWNLWHHDFYCLCCLFSSHGDLWLCIRTFPAATLQFDSRKCYRVIAGDNIWIMQMSFPSVIVIDQASDPSRSWKKAIPERTRQTTLNTSLFTATYPQYNMKSLICRVKP